MIANANVIIEAPHFRILDEPGAFERMSHPIAYGARPPMLAFEKRAG